MHTLSPAALRRARDFVDAQGGDIQRAWLRYQLDGGDADAFLDVLARHQHESGGFGGLVYEYAYNGPTLHDTEHAFRYLFYMRERPPADHPLIQRMMRYLLERYRPDVGGWGEVLEPGVNDGAHVWWWTYGEQAHPPIADREERVRVYHGNGNAGLAAFVAWYPELVPPEVYADILFYPTEKLLRHYGAADAASPYNLDRFQQFVACLPDRALAARLEEVLLRDPTACMETEETNWGAPGVYNHPPCELVQTPDIFLYPPLRELVDRSLDALMLRQDEDGGWHLPWSFGDGAELECLQADYEAHYTALCLATLARFGRIA